MAASNNRNIPENAVNRREVQRRLVEIEVAIMGVSSSGFSDTTIDYVPKGHRADALLTEEQSNRNPPVSAA